MLPHRQSHPYPQTKNHYQQPIKRWSCTIDMFSTGPTGGNKSGVVGNVPASLAVLTHPSHQSQHQVPVTGQITNCDYGSTRRSRRARPLSSFALYSSADSISLLTNIPMFDPNDSQYRCLCGLCHSTTGVRIIAGMLCLSVIYELWQLCWQSFITSSPSLLLPAIFNDDINITMPIPSISLEVTTISAITPSATATGPISSSLFQLFFGLFIVGTVMLSLWRENSALLLPYMLLQAVGLGAVFIIFLALLYIVLDNDLDTIKILFDSYGPVNLGNDDNETNNNNRQHNHYIVYMGWFLCASFLCLLAIQLWLLLIVFACWRYFRDNKIFFGGSDVLAHPSLIGNGVQCPQTLDS